MRCDENSTHFDIIFALPITGIHLGETTLIRSHILGD